MFDNGFAAGERLPPATLGILIATAAVFLLQTLAGMAGLELPLDHYFGLSLSGLAHGRLWQPLTYLLLHGGLWHFFVNMLALFFFGPEVERAIGTRRFLAAYLLCGLAAGLGWILISALPQQYAGPCIGASGAVFGVMGIFGALFPNRVVTLLLFFVIPITMTARTLVITLMAVALLSLGWEQGGIAHAAHLAGGFAGYLYGRRLARSGFDGWVCYGGGRGGGGRSWTAWWQTLRGAWRTRRMRVVSARDVDRILDKLHRHGYSSLTAGEREQLDRAARQ